MWFVSTTAQKVQDREYFSLNQSAFIKKKKSPRGNDIA